MYILYFFIAVLAISIGELVGIGGGIILKPILDFLGGYSIDTINLISSCTVVVIATAALISMIRWDSRLKIRKTICISIGTIVGGFLGDKILSNIMVKLSNDFEVIMYQNIVMAILLAFVFVCMNKKFAENKLNVENDILCSIVGILLGTILSFLSIGGVLVNICVLKVFFSMGKKEVTINSIIIILFTQLPKILTSIDEIVFGYYDLEILPIVVIGGLIGSILGLFLNKSIGEGLNLKVLNMVIAVLILLNIYNVSSAFI